MTEIVTRSEENLHHDVENRGDLNESSAVTLSCLLHNTEVWLSKWRIAGVILNWAINCSIMITLVRALARSKFFLCL